MARSHRCRRSPQLVSPEIQQQLLALARALGRLAARADGAAADAGKADAALPLDELNLISSDMQKEGPHV